MPSNQQSSFEPDDAERLLSSLAGVVSAHVVFDGAGRPLEIHILATPDLHPKQVVRNVESALSAGLGIEVDRRIVSVAQIRHDPSQNAGADGGEPDRSPTSQPVAEGDPAATEAAAGTGDAAAEPAGSGTAVPFLSVSPGGRRGGERRAERSGGEAPSPGDRAPRPEFVRFGSSREAGECECTVVLRLGERQEEGVGRGPDTAQGRALAGARAVFDALAGIRPTLELELGGVAISQSRGRSYVIASAHAVSDRQLVPLSGAASLDRSPEEAGILAALQASNRRSR